MIPAKPWYASAGVWGALVTLAGSVLSILKVELDPQLLDDIGQWLLSLATLVGGAVALWGRIRATRRIGETPLNGAGGGPGSPGSFRVIRVLLLIVTPSLAASLLVGAGGCAGPARAHVTADRATFEAIAPEYRAYVGADASLTEEQRSRRDRTLELWRLRIESAEANLDSIGDADGSGTPADAVHAP